MELPKNITQIGESDKSCKIYVEDYVVSYIKQRNRLAENKKAAVALYGIRREENEISYLFLYGAGKLETIQREVRHLSQAQNQEIESIRRRYFDEYQFLGYRLLDGEMVEGFHICEQGICRYISGYAQFYEKNDMMLAYMLDTREDEPKPEEVNQEKYERVRQRQEERRISSGSPSWQAGGRQAEGDSPDGRLQNERQEASGKTRENSGAEGHGAGGDESRFRVSAPGNRRTVTRPAARRRVRERAGADAAGRPQASRSVAAMRTCIVGAFVVLCILGVASMNGGLENLQVAARQFVEGITEQKIPDAAVPAMNQEGPDMLVTEDKLTDAIKKENEAGGNSGQTGTDAPNPVQGQDGMITQPGMEGQPAETEAVPSDQAGGTERSGGTTTDSGSQLGGDATAPGVQANGTGTASGSQTEGTDQPPQPDGEGQTGTSAGQPEAENQTGAEDRQDEGQQETAPQPDVKETSGPVGYVIQKGDTLIGISFRQYGTDARVQEICDLNKIENPDNIRIGQKILLPQ